MINQNSLGFLQCQEVLEMFCNYMNEINFVINKVKKSIYEICNIKMPLSQVIAQNNVASLTVNGKRTLDELKKIASVLRGYSRSKTVQRQEEQTRRSRVQNSSLSRVSRSRMSKYSDCQSGISPSRIERTTTNGQDGQKEQISMVTFQMPTPSNKRQSHQSNQLMKKLNKYHSLRTLHKISDVLTNIDPSAENDQTAKFNHTFDNSMHNNSPINDHIQQQSSIKHKRAKTFQKSSSNYSISRVLTQTQNKFKQCFEKRDSGMNVIIKNHNECLQILNDIHSHLKNKKNNKYSQPLSPSQQMLSSGIRKISAVYKQMTPSNKKEHRILVR